MEMHAYCADERLYDVASLYGVMDGPMPPVPMTAHNLLAFNPCDVEITGDAQGLGARVAACAMTEGGRRTGKGPGRMVFVYMIGGAMNRVLGLDPSTLVTPRAIEPGESAVIDRLLPDLIRVVDDRRAIVETLDAHLLAALAEAPPLGLEDAALAMLAGADMLPLPLVAQRLGISQRTLQRRFLKRHGCPPSRYLRHLRLMRSHPDSLRDVEWSRVPPELEYFDQPHWLRDMREIYGTNPTEMHAMALADWHHYPPGCFDKDAGPAGWQEAYVAKMRDTWWTERRELIERVAS